MKKLLIFGGSQAKPGAGAVLDLAVKSPKSGVALASRGVIFVNIEEWQKAAAHAVTASPHAMFWRSVALQYPADKAAKQISEFWEIMRRKPLLAEQARALLLSIPSKKLPDVEILLNLSEENDEFKRLKTLLLTKKNFSEEKFLMTLISEIVSPEPEGQVSFPIYPIGKKVVCESRLFSAPLYRRRLKTVYGEATIVAVKEKHYDDTGLTIFRYVLVDGETKVRKLRGLAFDKIKLSANRSMQVNARS